MRPRRALLRAALPAPLAILAACAGTTPSAPAAPAAAGSGGTTAAGAPAASSPTGSAPTAAVFPKADWERADPAATGFDRAKLQAVADAAEKSGSNCMLVTRHGKVVGEWYWNGTKASSTQEVFSATKSYASTLVGIAQSEGKLDITDAASKYITEWKGTPAEAITVKHLLSNNSGRHWDYETDYIKMAVGAPDKTQFAIDLGVDAAPGEVWAYNNSAIQTLDRVLTKATGRSPADYAEEKLLGPIGMADSTMKKDKAGNTLTFMGLDSSCRDMARFGWLFLNRGNWDGTQVVPSEWVKEATTSSQDLNQAYGYLWWLNHRGTLGNPAMPTTGKEGGSRIGQMVEGAPENAFFALGAGGQQIEVFPDQDVVAVRLAPVNVPKGSPGFEVGDLAKVVTEALQD